jgi:hypothetical protein
LNLYFYHYDLRWSIFMYDIKYVSKRKIFISGAYRVNFSRTSWCTEHGTLLDIARSDSCLDPLFVRTGTTAILFIYGLTGLNFYGFEGVSKNAGVIKMKQKYTIVRDDKNKQLIIREFAELDKEILSLLCEETYDEKQIRAAIRKGRETLIAALRTNNLYPPGIYADKIADAVKGLYAAKAKASADLFFDDLELLAKEQKAETGQEQLEKDSEDLDAPPEDDFEAEFEDEEPIKKMDSSLKIADDEFGDTNGDS